MARKKTDVEDSPKFDYLSMLNETVDAVAQRIGYDSDSLEGAEPMQTSLLCLDLIYGGGIRPGWYTHFGKEQSSKTTGTIALMASAIKNKVPLISYSDYEGSSVNSLPYIQSILKTVGVNESKDQIFGKKDPTTGKWIVKPIIRFHAESIGERFFDFLSEVLRNLPDKRRINNKWWLIYEDNKKNKAALADFCDSTMAKKYGNGIWVPAEDGSLQALFIVDSYAAMNPESNDEEEQDKSIALQARMFSKHLPRVKGRMVKKMVAVVGTNQLRDVPMAMFGPKENQPGGQALKFNSDARTKFVPRASSAWPLWGNKGPFDKETYWLLEKSVEVEQGRDSYRYVRIESEKNKLSTPGRKSWLRIWVNDGFGNARGYDPVFDTLYYLYLTGQLSGKKKSQIKLHLNSTDIEPVTDWYTLKKWILGSKQDKKDISTELGYSKPFCLRNYCQNQMRRGISEKLYVEHSQKSGMDDEAEE